MQHKRVELAKPVDTCCVYCVVSGLVTNGFYEYVWMQNLLRI